MTILARCIHEFCNDHKIQQINFQQEHGLEAKLLAYPNGLMPLLADYASDRLYQLGFETSTGLRNINDREGLLSRRTVFESPQAISNLMLTVNLVVGAVDCALTVSRDRGLENGRISLDYLATQPTNPAGGQFIDASTDLVQAMFNAATQKNRQKMG
ncbi:hypothetical protein A3709_19665 [Halioglobus sp. HI00S01]|uniref:hypothetical protein n=1 Tax=Halioglobus sp. HI00S01 TaxID=1822214 RepID=UPI0007C402A9|nr:hypothetical protein [Halioglobus sp. HI00S01]KZX57844.1 hypothetical protein A3709_19665 [Halioglobus sp. HI00S01]